ncbi:MAG TPA: Hpt domain-containing protein [Longimicrobiales bacterium]|nr:Hpt domain-containing protein [Longimicrobiales bacterium]
MDDLPIVDQTALSRLQRLGGNKLVAQMIRLYLENAGERLRQIDAGLAPGGNPYEAEAGAHSLKSSAANVGAAQVSATATAMETAAHRGEWERLRELREPLAAALERAADRLDQISREMDG